MVDAQGKGVPAVSSDNSRRLSMISRSVVFNKLQ